MNRLSTPFLLLLLLLLAACQTAVSPTPSIATATPPVAATPTATPQPTSTPTPQPTPTIAVEQPAPRVRIRQPASGTLASPTPRFLFTFTEPMNEASVRAALTIEPPVPFELAWDEEKLTVITLEPLQFETAYRVRLATTAVSQHNVPLSNPFDETYTLAPILRRINVPDDNAQQRVLSIAWHYPIITDSLSATIRPAVEGEWKWTSSRKELRFIPAQPYAPNTTYRVTFAGEMQTEQHQQLALPKPVVFTTANALFSASPLGQFRGAASRIEIEFNQPMDQESVENAFALSPALPGTIEWVDNSLIFTPESGRFEFSTDYSYTIGAGAKTALGQPAFAEEGSWQFSTAAFQPLADFGYGPNIQVVDANGRRHFQYRTNWQRPVNLTFNLYSSFR